MTTWNREHADWWRADSGESIHRVEILDDDDRLVNLFYGYAFNALRHCLEALSLGEAQRAMDRYSRRE